VLAREVGDISLLALCGVSFFNWLRYRKLNFSKIIGPKLESRFRILLTFTVAAIVIGLIIIVVGGAILFHTNTRLTIASIICGAIVMFIAIGAGWPIPSIRNEVYLRSVGAGRYTDNQLLNMLSIRRALLVRAPVSVAIAVTSIAILVIAKLY
jgi:hypothetical protein